MNSLSKTQSFATPVREATLIVIGKNGEISSCAVKDNMTIGKNTPVSQADIHLDSAIVSKKHGFFTWDGNNWYYTDCNESNGSYVNGVYIGKNNDSGKRAVMLSDGDVIRVDRMNLNEPHPEAVTMIFSTSYDKNSQWYKYRLAENANVCIGRGGENGINLNKGYISREHAVIYVRGGKYYIENCDSKNGVFVNNRLVYDTAELYERNVIKICDTFILVLNGCIVYNVNSVAEKGLVVDISDVGVPGAFNNKKILGQIHLEVDNGDFVLILGGSGAGKSTLVNSILGKYKMHGHVEVEGEESKNGIRGNHRIAYVPQSLPLRKEEKLIDVITDTANMRMNGKMSGRERKEFILETLDSLGLSAKADLPIKNLSGGEQRRAAIANEVVTNPDIFFLDEPDSGLDPKSGMELMGNLKALTKKGKMVMLISHNYASYPRPEEIYTKVVVLAKSDTEGVGKLAFMGSVTQALEFFGVSELKDITKLINPTSENGDGRADEFVEKYNRMCGI